ncbi:hypothetical protein EKI60_06275 [Candidatus Saccharibacteria bacterium]|nr:MAG: hypothetical protein EKI60_06275 [Candidatus Saccharibacteria bacterium]
MTQKNLPEPECKLGFTAVQVKTILGDDTTKFYHWIAGQTMALCEGTRYDYETKRYEESCGGAAHGPIVYPWDLNRYLSGLPIID